MAKTLYEVFTGEQPPELPPELRGLLCKHSSTAEADGLLHMIEDIANSLCDPCRAQVLGPIRQYLGRTD